MNKNFNFADELKETLHEAINQAVENYHSIYTENHYNIQNQEEIKGRRNFTRNRKLSLETMIKFILGMNGGSLNTEIKRANLAVSPSAVSQQRKKIEPSIFEDVLSNFNDMCSDDNRYRGLCVYAIDGTTLNIAKDESTESYFPNTKGRKGYNQLHLNILYDILNKSYDDCVIQPHPKQNESDACVFLLQHLGTNDLLLGDRNYGSYNTFAHLNEKNIKFIIRLRHGKTKMVALRGIEWEKESDTDVTVTMTDSAKEATKENYVKLNIPKNPRTNSKAGSRWDFAIPYTLSFRVVRIKLDSGEFATFGTNLPRDFSAEEIKKLYHLRWNIELAIRDLKYGFGLVHTHSKSEKAVGTEVFATMIISNFTQRIVDRIPIQQKETNVYTYRINFKMAIQLCKEFFRNDDMKGKKLTKEIAKYVEPIREGRSAERNMKSKAFVSFNYRVPT